MITIETIAVDIDYQFNGEDDVPIERIYQVYKTIDGDEFLSKEDAVNHTISILNKPYEIR